MRVLVVGGGGREHALAWRLAADGAEVICAPGNGGTASTVAGDGARAPANGRIANAPGRPAGIVNNLLDPDGLADLATGQRVALTVVGPEAPLADGIVDNFLGRGLAIFGPTRAAARLEASKAWTKAFLLRHTIPTGRAEIVDNLSSARRAIARTGLPVAIKADGLASGKGVWVALDAKQADAALDALFTRRLLGAAGEQVLIEEFLEGVEVSLLAFTDGERLGLMPPARDYKRLLDGDAGPNTGGMGGYTRPGYASAELLELCQRTILRPTLAGMAAEGAPYRGVLYAGLMLTIDGPRVLEFNCRFGDPEAQLILPLLRSSLVDTCAAVAEGRLEPTTLRWSDEVTCGVVLAAPGYPERPQLGAPIGGLDQVPADVHVFHAGTRRCEDGRLLTTGGRVLTLVGRGPALAAARERVYTAAPLVDFDGKQYRSDIGIETGVLAGA